MALWVAGGLLALAGALAYGELAAALPRSGGEYHFLGRIYHPRLGEAAGIVSVVVGFAAPVALAAMALGRYAAAVVPVPPLPVALGAIVLVSAFHAVHLRAGQGFQLVTTALKIALVLVFCVAGLLAPAAGDTPLGPPAATLDAVASPAFALGLIWVYYAYSGWNAATYFAGEVRNPARDLPRALVAGTLLVMVLYVVLNAVFLRVVPFEALAGTVEVGALAADAIFGAEGGRLVSAMLSLLLLSTISAMVLAGPRVLQVMGEDLPVLRPLAARTRGGVPLRALLLQQGLAVAFAATGSFEGVLSYAGFTLTLFAMLTVLGVVVLRRREPDLPRPYRTWGYPFTPLLFVGVNAVMLALVLWERPLAGLAGALTVAAALALGLGGPRRGAGSRGP
jgi:APA family basic amino acid/polyamine antiporter